MVVKLELALKTPTDAGLVAALISGVTVHEAQKGNANLVSPIKTKLVLVKAAIESNIAKTMQLPFTAENKIIVKALYDLLKVNENDFPEEKFFSGGVTDKIFAAKIIELLARHDQFDAEILKASQIKEITDAAKACTDAKTDIAKLCTAVATAKAALHNPHFAAYATQLATLKTALTLAANKVLTEIQKWVAMTGGKVAKSSAELKKLRALKDDAQPIKAFTKRDLGIDQSDDTYFETDYDKLTNIEKETVTAVIKNESATLNIATVDAAKAMNVSDLIIKTRNIFEVLPSGANLSILKDQVDTLKDEYKKLHDTIGFCVAAVAHLKAIAIGGTDVQNRPRCDPILTLLQTNKIVGVDRQFGGLVSKQFDGTDSVLFKGDVDAIIAAATPAE